MADNRPVGRKKTYGTGNGRAKKTGSGLGTGPVGTGGYAGRKTGSGAGSQGGFGVPGGQRAGGSRGGGSPLMLIIIAAIVLLGGGGGLGSLLGGGGSSSSSQGYTPVSEAPVQSTTQTPSASQSVGSSTAGSYVDLYSQLFGSGASSSGQTFSADWSGASLPSHSSTSAAPAVTNNSGQTVNTTVVNGAREKYTKILGGRRDKVTMMVYMCGADLESQSGMATKDLQEMCGANTDNINLIVYTGGAKRWNNSVISNQTNQIYQVTGGGLRTLNKNAGNAVMTDPNTLASFIQYCGTNFPANRNILIFWNHGGGSVSGYGYDEKNPYAGSMSLSGIYQALAAANMKFDFIGFDTCLLATCENGLMLNDFADYMVASEESEPGVGWYYTRWVQALNDNTSIPTLDLGRQIVDDFTEACARTCRGQKTTLSVVDLAELNYTVPDALKAFSTSTIDLIKSSYRTVSNARYSSREFAQSSRIDQVDLIDFAQKVGTEEGMALAKALAGAIKYNRTSTNMTNAYGLSIYFPYSNARYLDKAVKNYRAIGLDDEYSRCIQAFATMETSGQAAAGGSASPYSQLTGSYGGTSYGSSSDEMISALLSAFLTGGSGSSYGRIKGLNADNTAFLSESGVTQDEAVSYIGSNYFDGETLHWVEEGGKHLLAGNADFSLVHELDLNLFYDDGEGYIDLGLDNVFEFTDDGALIGDTDGTWLAVNGQLVAYYHLDTMGDDEDYVITGYIPALLNDERVNLLVTFDTENPEGYIAGATYDYIGGETETVGKTMSRDEEEGAPLVSVDTENPEGNVAAAANESTGQNEELGAIFDGDKLQFLCDYYSYDGEYLDSYTLGDAFTVNGDLEIRNIPLEGTVSAMYRLTDIYNQEYWTPALVEKW